MDVVDSELRFFTVRALPFALLAALVLAIPAPSARAGALPISTGSWTLAVLPDTQGYAHYHPQHFLAQTQWIKDHAASHNIKYVLHEGDVTDDNVTAQWDIALEAMNKLNGVVPYAMSSGNHDDGPLGSANNRISLFDDPAYFGPGSYYATQPSIGGFYSANRTVNSYHTFTANNQDWLVLDLEYAPSNPVVSWANQVVDQFPDHKTMLVTHTYMYHDDTRYDWAAKGFDQEYNPHWTGIAFTPGETVNDGQELWDKLVSRHANFNLVFSGHTLGDGTGYRSDLNIGGNPVHQMLANYQFKPEGGSADLRLLEFKTDGTVSVQTYSPSLDRNDTAYDQQFTFQLNELRGFLTPPTPTPPPNPTPPPPVVIPPSPPPISSAVVANLVVTGDTNPSANTVGGIEIAQTSSPAISILARNRGDYEVAVNGAGVQYFHGVLLSTITQHSRPDFANRHTSVEVGRNSFSDGLLTLSLTEAGNPLANEVNFNNAVAWFQFNTGWEGAHVNGSGALATGAYNRVDQAMITHPATGRYKIDLGVNARTDGLLFVTANNNDNTVIQAAPFENGNGWDVRVGDNGSDFASTGENRDFSFVYLPYGTPRLIGGFYDGVNDSHISSAGSFTMSRLASGQYELTIPGESPISGMLLLNVAGRVTDLSVTAPNDNILSYEASPTGSFLINSYDLPGTALEDSLFQWAFLSFANPITPLRTGDYDRNGVVDMNDLAAWKLEIGNVGLSLAADGNRDGTVDAADYVIWRKDFIGMSSSLSSAGVSQVPEPSTLIGIALLIPTFCLLECLDSLLAGFYDETRPKVRSILRA